MQRTVLLGRTKIQADKNGFGALPVQRAGMDDAVKILRRAYDNGVNYYDTALAYSDSEEKIGAALSGVRDKIYIATKTPSVTVSEFWEDLETSLRRMKTDYIDVFQFHNPAFCPKPGDESGLYEAMCQAKKQGKIRFIGITNHRLAVAWEAVESGLYDTLQFPFCYLSGEEEEKLVKACEDKNMGFIAMKALSGGLITNAAAAYVFMQRYESVLPIWGIQRMEELEEFLSFSENPPRMEEALSRVIETDRAQLAGEFCRGCGYCMPCPAQIEISNCARMSLLLRRSPKEQWLTPQWREKMARIENCLHCGQCKKKCPYALDTPALLRKNYEDYRTFL